MMAGLIPWEYTNLRISAESELMFLLVREVRAVREFGRSSGCLWKAVIEETKVEEVDSSETENLEDTTSWADLSVLEIFLCLML